MKPEAEYVSQVLEGIQELIPDYNIYKRLQTALERQVHEVVEDAKKDSWVLRVDGLELDLTDYSAKRNGISVILTRTEFSLLKFLMSNKGRAFSESVILQQVWKTRWEPGTNRVAVYIAYLRKKVDRDFEKKLIQTVWGFGYKISE